MSIFIKFKNTQRERDRAYKKILDKYPQANNAALRGATLFLEGKVKDDFLTVQDGDPRKGDRRTKPDGLRTITGLTKRSVGSAVLTGNNRFILLRGLSKALKTRVKGLLKAGLVGLSDPTYAVDHERFGKKRQPGFYPFLAPALDKYRRETWNVFQKILKRELARKR